MCRATCLGVFAVLAVLAQGTDVRADEKEEWKGLKGVWKVEKAVFRGKDETEVFKTAVLTMDEGKYDLEFAGEDKGTVSLDASKKPKRMTIVGVDGRNKGKTFTAIYELADDTLKICYDLEGKVFPTAFESKAETASLLITYKRAKKDKDKKDKK
jgi:uncharacterized protein (TIGR03067 family)